MYIRAYETTFGKILNITNIENDLKKFFIINNNIDFSYGIENYEIENVNFKFLIGTSNEKNISVFDHPIIIENRDKSKSIITDLRKYTKPNIDYNDYKRGEKDWLLNFAAKDKSSIDFCIIRALLTSDMIKERFVVYSNLFKYIIPSYSNFITDMISKTIVGLDVIEQITVKTVIGLYISIFQTQTNVLEYDDIISIFKSRVQNSYGMMVNQDNLNTIADKCTFKFSTFSELVENIKANLPYEKSKLISTDIVFNKLSNLWYGPGGSETILIGLEDMATWFTLLYSCSDNTLYKKTRLGSLLDLHRRTIRLSDYSNELKSYLNTIRSY